jgi:hypothetical protein
MGMSEEWFWNCTPKKLIAILEEKKRIEKVKQKNLAIYIACYVWGKNPDKYEVADNNAPIAGRDVPIDPTRLNALLM